MADLCCLACGEPWGLDYVLHSIPGELVCDFGLWPDILELIDDKEAYDAALADRWEEAGHGRVSALANPEVEKAVAASFWKFYGHNMGLIMECPNCADDPIELTAETLAKVEAWKTHSPEDLTSMMPAIMAVVAEDPGRREDSPWREIRRGIERKRANLHIHGIRLGGPEFFGVPTAAANPVYVVDDNRFIDDVLSAINAFHDCGTSHTHASTYIEGYAVHVVYARVGMDTTTVPNSEGAPDALGASGIGCTWHDDPAAWLRHREIR